jgi:protein TonB
MASAAALRRRTIVLSFVIGLHVVLALGLIAATAIKVVPQLRDMLDAQLIKHEDEPPPKEPPPPPPDFKPPPITAPSIDIPVVAGPPVVNAIQVPKPVEAPPPKAAPPAIVPARLAKGLNLGDACSGYYPSASRRLSEEGSVVVLIYVAPNGRVTESKVETSSGIQRLDEATQKCVTAAGRFEPQKVGTEAVGSWQRMKYTWRLTS